jgi:single-stranded-DNA-specific exonuclease
MAAIATIADAVPLHGENRTIAALGLRELRRPVGAGLRALFSAAQVDPAAKPLTGFDVAFRLAPRINAAGRMDVASQVIELFCTRDGARANELAGNLELLNRQRREAEAAALSIIEARLAVDAAFAANRLLVVDGAGWHRGVIGILASRVVERTAKPAIVVSVEDNIAHGSGRSVDGFPLLEALETCGDLFTRFGGHAFAVGFAMPAASVPELRRRLNLHAEERLGASEPEHLLRIHAELPLDRITAVLAGWLKKLEPLGHGNPEPVFMARGVRLASAPRIMKERHIRLDLQQDALQADGLQQGRLSAGAEGRVMRCVGWDWAGRCLNMQLCAGSRVDVAYRIRENDHPQYGGVEIEMAGIRPAEA